MKKTRTIIAAVLMFLIVLLLIIIVVAVATRKPVELSKTNEENTSQIAENSDSKIENKNGIGDKAQENSKQGTEEDASDENLPPVSNDNKSATVQTAPNKKEPEGEDVKTIEIGQSNEDLPKTGPESALPLAILLGTVAMFLTSCICVREKRVL